MRISELIKLFRHNSYCLAMLFPKLFEIFQHNPQRLTMLPPNLIEFLSDVARVEQDIKLEGSSMSVLFAPDKRNIQMLKELEEKNKQ